MASYASIADAIAIYGDDYVTVACDRNRDGDIDTDALERALLAASDTIDGHFVGRVPGWPWVAVPRNLIKLTVDLAIYTCASTGRDTLTDHMKDLNIAAMEYLNLVAVGKIRLAMEGATAGPALNQSASTNTSRQNAVLMSPCARQFTRERMRGI